MGCTETKDTKIPALICFFEMGNTQQKEYCLKLKDNFKHEKSIRFEIKSLPDYPFSIKFQINGQIHDIQNTFDDSDQAMNDSLNKMYNLLQ